MRLLNTLPTGHTARLSAISPTPRGTSDPVPFAINKGTTPRAIPFVQEKEIKCQQLAWSAPELVTAAGIATAPTCSTENLPMQHGTGTSLASSKQGPNALYASCGTSTASPTQRAVVASAVDYTSVRSVVPPIITPCLSGASERDRIITPYDADVFEHTLRSLGFLHRYPDLPDRLRYGFPIGDFSPLRYTSCPPNHKDGIKNMDFITNYTREQVSLGRMTGPYTRT